MNYIGKNIVLQEHPYYVSLAYWITGCDVKCPQCNSKFLWDGNTGEPLTPTVLEQDLQKYSSFIDNVIFMGGEWYHDRLLDLLKLINYSKFGDHFLKTTLFTGREVADIPTDILLELDYIKVGGYDESKGDLTCVTTNQRMYQFCKSTDVTQDTIRIEPKDITSIFWKK